MTPQERQLVDDLFDRLARVESAPRDPDATAAISRGLQVAPNAIYALVQTVLLQDEALKRAHERIQQLEGGEEPEPNRGGFLDSMRDTIFGRNPEQSRGSVPNVRPPQLGSRPAWNTGQVLGPTGGQYNPPPPPSYGASPDPAQQSPLGGGGSFLGTAAAAAAGMVGGSLLLGSIRSMMGGGHQSYADQSGLGGGGGTPSGGDQSGGSLARDAGLNDIGSSGRHGDDSSRAGFFDQASADDDHDDMDLDADDFGSDSDSDVA